MITEELRAELAARLATEYGIVHRLVDEPCPVPAPAWAPSIGDYHASPEISSTSLKAFREDPQAYQRQRIWRSEVVEEPRLAHLDVGGAFGGYFLDRDEYRDRFARLDHSGRCKVSNMIASLKVAPMDTWAGRINRYLTTRAGRSEWSYRWVHPATGLLLRVRHDRLIGWRDVAGRLENRVTNLEVKTTRHVTPRKMRYDARDLGYHHQIALQEDGLRTAFPGVEVESLWAFVSTTPPHPAVILQPDPDRVADARAMNETHLGELAEMMQNPLEPVGPRRQPWELAGVPDLA